MKYIVFLSLITLAGACSDDSEGPADAAVDQRIIGKPQGTSNPTVVL